MQECASKRVKGAKAPRGVLPALGASDLLLLGVEPPSLTGQGNGEAERLTLLDEDHPVVPFSLDELQSSNVGFPVGDLRDLRLENVDDIGLLVLILSDTQRV